MTETDRCRHNCGRLA